MTKVLITQSKLDTLAEVIGGKSNTNVPLTVDEMITAADSITGGGGGGDGYVWQDGSGYVHLSDEEGTQPIYDTLNVSSSGTFTPATGHAYNSVVVPSGTEGTPTATKGTVSSHSIAITPSVTNTAGYISGGTKTGTAVSVSASELVSGNLPITQNGNNIDCANYSTVSVNVSGGVGGLEYEAGIWTPSTDTADYTISFTGTHTVAPFFYLINDSEGEYYTEANSNIQVRFVCPYLLGVDLYITGTNIQYATVASQYRGTSTTSFSSANATVTTNGSAVLSDYATSTGIRAYTNATSRYWRAGRAYKWIAVWAPTT